jgi:hypothetical protein
MSAWTSSDAARDSWRDAWDEEFDGAAEWLPLGEVGPGKWTGNIHGGWNMSDVARAYQRQISGRPAWYDYHVNRRGKKYDFDGYDSRRRTLLDAKAYGPTSAVVRAYQISQQGRPLPQRLAKQFSQLVADARRQRRAAGKTPIEWHVASSKAAEALRALLRTNGLLKTDQNRLGINVKWTKPNEKVLHAWRQRR